MSSAPDTADARQGDVAARRAFAARVAAWQAYMERALEVRLPATDAEPMRLHEAMRYCTLRGGKRVRPMLLFGSARAVGLTEGQVEAAACAIELVHAYSLVHDDLPAMDNDDLRHGRPTCHKAYDEATAVLVGDALQSLAFQLLASDRALPAAPAVRLRLIEMLAQAGGTNGMAGGQAMDVAVLGRELAVADVEAMYHRKTGALIRASVMMGAACAPASDAHLTEALAAFAAPIGLAFQIQDDLLDVLGDEATVGKPTRADGTRSKPTYPAILGVTASQERVRRLHAEALEALHPFGHSADALRGLADWLLLRSY